MLLSIKKWNRVTKVIWTRALRLFFECLLICFLLFLIYFRSCFISWSGNSYCTHQSQTVLLYGWTSRRACEALCLAKMSEWTASFKTENAWWYYRVVCPFRVLGANLKISYLKQVWKLLMLLYIWCSLHTQNQPLNVIVVKVPNHVCVVFVRPCRSTISFWRNWFVTKKARFTELFVLLSTGAILKFHTFFKIFWRYCANVMPNCILKTSSSVI